MLKYLRPRLTYANVLSSLALFVALGGGAYAASQLPAKSVGTSQLKNGAVTTKKVKDHTVLRKDVKAGQFATPGQLAGKLGVGAIAANSAKLGGVPPSGFLQGTGHLVGLNYDKTANEDALVPVPGGGAIALRCGTNGYNVWFKTPEREYDVFQSVTIDGNAPAVDHRTAKATDGFAFVPTKQDSEAHFDLASDAGGAALTVWSRFDNTTKHCIGRARGLALP